MNIHSHIILIAILKQSNFMIGYRSISYTVLNNSHAYSTLDNNKTGR